MTLTEYIRSERGNATRLASGLGISLSYLSQMASGHRPIPAELCPRIERLTAGQVPCEHTRPDVEWAVLRLQAAA